MSTAFLHTIIKRCKMESVWEYSMELKEYPRLKEDISTDVLIIGGGIAGILCAHFLNQKGIDCVIAEKSRVCSGTTGNTTAKITFQHGLIYQKILKNSSLETAQKYLRANQLAFEEYARLCSMIDCDYEIKDNYVYSVSDEKKLQNEMTALEKIGFNAELCKNLPLPVKTAGAVKFSNQAQFNPVKFLSFILKDIKVFENTFVREMIGTKAVTDFGSINAKKVVCTTHFPFINKHGGYFLKLYQHRSYVIALENAQEVNGMFVDENHSGLSFRNYGELLLFGGGSHRTGKKGGNWRELRERAAEYYPESHEKFFWAAQDCMSLDGIPYIGHYSKNTPNMFVASGFNKWGMTGAMVAAMLLSDLISEKENGFSDVFSPSRSMITPQLFVNGFESAKNLLTVSKKRCPHLGCALKWNSAEHSWDCPCHGSRFSEKGKVLDNPANGNLS